MQFTQGDVVWAKMKGFPPWPGLISHPPDGLIDGTVLKSDVKYFCIFFFGTHDYGFIDQNHLKPYLPFKEKMCKLSRTSKFKLACSEIEDYLNKSAKEEEHVDPESNIIKIEAETKSAKKEEHIDPESNIIKIEAETKPQVIGGEGTANLYPRIKLQKLHVIEDFLPLSNIPKSEKGKREKRCLASPKRVTKKKKMSSFSDPDTTTPLDAICQSSFDTSSDQFSKDEISISSSEDHSGEEEAEEEGERNNDSVDEGTDTSSNEILSSIRKIGFIGLGIMGRTIANRLLQDGHELVIWNRSPEKVTDFQNIGVRIAKSPADVVASAKIIFCCVTDGSAVKNVLFSEGGALHSLTPEKSFVDLSSSDVQSSLDMSEAIFSKGSRYLEVRMSGSKKDAEEGSLVCLSAGDESLHNDCLFFYRSCSKQSFFMGEAGNASRFYLVMQSVAGVALAGLAECMALADRAGLDQNDLLSILKISKINCPLIVEHASAMVNGDFTTNMALKNMQSNLQSVIAIGEELEQPTPVTATANEIFKHAKKVGYGGHDVSAVYLGSKF